MELGLWLDQQLFINRPERLNTAGVSDFYAAALRVWQLLRPTRDGGVVPGPWVWEETIFHNPLITGFVGPGEQGGSVLTQQHRGYCTVLRWA